MHHYTANFTRHLKRRYPNSIELLYFSDVKGRFPQLADRGPLFSGVKSRVFREQVVVPSAIGPSIDRLLVPAYLGAICSPVPTDLIWYDFLFDRPDSGLSMRQKMYWQKFHERSVKQADRVFPISQATGRELRHRFSGENVNVGPVLYPGQRFSYRRRNPDKRSRRQMDSPFILTVGTVSPRKNIGTLVEWFNRSQLHSERGIELRIAGGHGWGTPTPTDLHNPERGVISEGRVSVERLHFLYNRAELLVLPSTGEGFGLPVLEAFFHRLPVVLNDIEIFREVAGQAAWFLPGRSKNWSTLMKRALDNSIERRRKTTRGMRRLRQFKWSRAVTKYLDTVGFRPGRG